MVSGVIGYIPEYRGVTGTPPGVIGPHGPKVVEEERHQEVARGPLAPIRIGKGKGAAAPLLLLSLHLLLPPSPSWNKKGGQNLLVVGLPPLGSPNCTRRGVAPPLSFLSPSPSFPLPPS